MVERSAARRIERLPDQVKRRVVSAIQALSDAPRPDGCRKLKGYNDRYRIRVGDYRVIYDVFDSRLVVIVIDAGHRGSIY